MSVDWRTLTLEEIHEAAHIVAKEVMQHTSRDSNQICITEKSPLGGYEFHVMGNRNKVHQSLSVIVEGQAGTFESNGLRAMVNEILNYIACEWCGDDAGTTQITDSYVPRTGGFKLVGSVIELM